MTDLIRRSELALPACNDHMFAKGVSCGADLVFLDLEDATPVGLKVESRAKAIRALTELDFQPELVAVADLSEPAREWFRRIPSVQQLCADYRELLANPAVDVVYAAVPHHLHEQIYLDVLAAGKDLFADKPFGIDLRAARRVVEAIERSGRFVRCSSEMPFFPGAQRIVDLEAGVRDLDLVSLCESEGELYARYRVS